MTPVHFVDSTLVNVATGCFLISYIVGLFAGARFARGTLWPSVVIGLLSCVVRAQSAPLSLAAIASISALHLGMGCLTVLVLKRAKPYSGGSSAQP